MTPIEQARNLGPTSGAELRSVGIESLEQLIDIGWEEAFEKWVIAYPERVNLNAATALIGAVENCDWREVPASLKSEAKVLVRSYR